MSTLTPHGPAVYLIHRHQSAVTITLAPIKFVLSSRASTIRVKLYLLAAVNIHYDSGLHPQDEDCPKTIVVVAPRILLANQLCDEFMQQVSSTWTHICHCHSGETKYFSSTKSEKIALFANTARAAGESVIIFTTYHSLRRVVDSGIDIDCAYFDEAHNSVTRSFSFLLLLAVFTLIPPIFSLLLLALLILIAGV